MNEQRYRNILNAAFGSVWAIMPGKLEAIVDFLSLQSSGVKFTADDLELRAGPSRGRRMNKVNGKVAVLPLYGVISQKANMLTEFSGGTSTEMFSNAFDDAMANKDVKAIVIDADSPGGTISGVPELAEKIHSARGQGKQIVTVANSLAASAGYWLGAAADQFVITPSGEAGSIGVYCMHQDWSEYNAKAGIKPTYVSAGKYKIEGNPDNPLDATSHAAIQASVDEAYEMFVDDVARFRGATPHKVRNGYGEGRCLSAHRAVAEGLADRVATLDKVLAELGVGRPVASGKRAEGDGMHPVAEAESSDDLDMKRRRWRNVKRKVGLE